MNKKVADRIIANFKRCSENLILDAKKDINDINEIAEKAENINIDNLVNRFNEIKKFKDKMPENFSSFLVPTKMDEQEKYQYQLDCLYTSIETCRIFSEVGNKLYECAEDIETVNNKNFSVNKSLEELVSGANDKIDLEQKKWLKNKNTKRKAGLKLWIPFLCIFIISLLVVISIKNSIGYAYRRSSFELIRSLYSFSFYNLILTWGGIIPGVILFGLSFRKDEVTKEDVNKLFTEVSNRTINDVEEQYGLQFSESKSNALDKLNQINEKLNPFYIELEEFREKYVFRFLTRTQIVEEAIPAYEILKSGESTTYANALSIAKEKKRKDDEFEAMANIEKEKLLIERIKADNQRATNAALVESARNTERAQQEAAAATAAAAATTAAIQAERLRNEKKVAKDTMKTNKKIRDSLN